MQVKALEYLPDDMKSVVLRYYDRFVKNSILHGSGEKEQSQAVMLWKLGLGNMGKLFNGEDPMPDKTKVAKSTSWKTEPMPQTDISKIEVSISIPEKDMFIIRKGHIPVIELPAR